jgi:hypothetical protein
MLQTVTLYGCFNLDLSLPALCTAPVHHLQGVACIAEAKENPDKLLGPYAWHSCLLTQLKLPK